MKTMEEAARAVYASDSKERYGEITNAAWQCPEVLRVALEVMGHHGATEAMRVMGGVIAGICIGMEMEKP